MIDDVSAEYDIYVSRRLVQHRRLDLRDRVAVAVVVDEGVGTVGAAALGLIDRVAAVSVQDLGSAGLAVTGLALPAHVVVAAFGDEHEGASGGARLILRNDIDVAVACDTEDRKITRLNSIT